MKNKNQKQPELNSEQIQALMDLPFEYLKSRAHEEKVKWDLELSFFVNGFEKGGREFFGLNLNDLCFPIYDLQEPYQGFLNNFISWYQLTNGENNLNLKQNKMKSKEMFKVLIELQNKYCDLVWYARSFNKHDQIEGVLENLKRVEKTYPDEINKLLNEDKPDWTHGFNSGMLAGIRYCLDLNIHGKEDADESFPCLDS